MTSEPGGVHVDLAAVNRRLRQNGHDGVTLEFRPATAGNALPVVRAAAGGANDRVASETVYAEGVSSSVRGTLVHLTSVGTAAQNDAWLAAFIEGLEHAGWSGKVGPARQTYLPKEIEDHARPRLTCYLGYTADSAPADPPPSPRWGVDAGLTESLLREAVAWGSWPDAEVYLWEGRGQVRLVEPDVAPLLLRALRRSGSCGVTYVCRSPVHVHRASFHGEGHVTYQVDDQVGSWQAQVNRLREVLEAHPAQVDLGFVRWSHGWAHSWDELANAHPRLPFVNEGMVRNNRRLWRDYTPDAHGVQLLTGAHLAKGRDLGSWDIREVARDRFLVEARDLEPWFGAKGPELGTVDHARRNFGDMLLTPEVVLRQR